eukprot:TRINITY_DN68056_c0_g3_i2.p1 TRINITY_DN68056_c0_g3~~TRINITY_DN68056_c0_g3_i2.p1  ORF type:complete len:398 (+),score=209.28 TRINITY_DN68056_c0_g3_i2:542-1735(+)
MFDELLVVHIDESTVLECAASASRLDLANAEYVCVADAVAQQLDAVIAEYRHVQMRKLVVPLERVFSIGVDSTTSDNDDGSSDKERLVSLLGSMETATDKNDLVRLLRGRLLAYLAQQHKMDKVVLGTTANRTAVDIISNTSKGRGFAVPAVVQSIEMRHNTLMCRPNKALLKRTVAMYNRATQLDQHVRVAPDFATGLVGAKGGIDKLAEQFVELLQSKFDHSIPNVIRTCEKLQRPPYLDAALPASKTQVKADKARKRHAKRMEARRLRKQAEAQAAVDDESKEEEEEEEATTKCVGICALCGRGVSSLKSAVGLNTWKRQSEAGGNERVKQFEALFGSLCYGCTALFNHSQFSDAGMQTVAKTVPAFVTGDKSRDRMRAMIADCLVADDDDGES